MDIATDNINISDICEITANTYRGPDCALLKSDASVKEIKNFEPKPVIGVIKDSAFQFYYPENIESLIRNGAEIIYISPLKDVDFPEIDALYIGGGFPETHAEQISENVKFNTSLKDKIENGLPVYAECGGLMYMGESIQIGDNEFKMTGVFPISFGISQKPQGHGYVVAEVVDDNPYYEKGEIIKGHEFRYSKILKWDKSKGKTAFKMQRGTGMENKDDGICYKNLFATYVHIHASGTPSWGKKMVENAKKYKTGKL
jgi:cobyrinic acid a,c-diamide synthase